MRLSYFPPVLFRLMSHSDCQESLNIFFLYFLQSETDVKDIFPYGKQTNGTVTAFFLSFFFLEICNAFSNYFTVGCLITAVYEATKSLL